MVLLLPGRGFPVSFFPDGFQRSNDAMIAPAIIPQSNVRKMTMAREASKCHRRKVMTVGWAFWTENIPATTKTMAKKMSAAINYAGTLFW